MLRGRIFDFGSWPRYWRHARSVVALIAIVWAVVGDEFGPGRHDGRVLVVTLMGIAGTGWLLGLFVERWPGWAVAGLGVCCGVGATLVAIGPRSSIGFVLAGCVSAAAKLRPVWSALFTAVTAMVYVLCEIAVGASTLWTAGGAAACAVAFMTGLIRYQINMNAEQVELRLAEAQHAREEQARATANAEQAAANAQRAAANAEQAAALAERARIAREIHDILAHALAALSVQLETVDALIERGRDEQARATLGRARQLTREGLAETRRAVSALRGDPLPLPSLLQMLASGYVADTGAEATVELRGDERPLSPDVGLVFYRTAQEAITNVRKHAPGASITMSLGYRAAEVTLVVANLGGGPPVAGAQGGYGLTGLRERAALVSGRFIAGPVEEGWRVEVGVPA